MTHPTKNSPVGAGLKPGPTTSAAPSQQTATASHRRAATTELGPLPEDWRVVRLGEIATISRKPRGLKLPKQVPFIPMASIPDNGTLCPSPIEWKPAETISGTYCEGGDILFAKITPSLENGKQGIVPKTLNLAYATTEVYPLKVNEQVDTLFLFNLLRAPWVRAHLAGKMEGSTGRQRLAKRVLLDYSFPLPPLPEQRAIAHVLRAVQEASEATARIIAALRDVKKSLMRHLFTYGPVPVGARRTVPQRQTDIGPIPAHWRVVRLGEVVTTTSGGTPNRSNPKYFGGSIPWLKSGELQDSPIFGSKEFLTQNGLENSSAKIFPKGTLLIALYGATAGKVGILKIDAATNQAICALLPNDANTLPDYLFYALIYRREALKAQRYGGAQPNLSQRAIRSFQIPLPPLAEQREIARQLQALDRKIEAEEARKNALDDLFRSLLHHLMTAQRRLPANFIARFAA